MARENIMRVSKNILGLFIGQILSLLLTQNVFCQTETLDIVTYTPPKGWAKTFKEGAVVFSDVNKTTNTFCVLTIHSATASAGSPEKDFANEWKTLVVIPHKAADNPKTETEIRDGWTLISANAPVESEGTK